MKRVANFVVSSKQRPCLFLLSQIVDKLSDQRITICSLWKSASQVGMVLTKASLMPRWKTAGCGKICRNPSKRFVLPTIDGFHFSVFCLGLKITFSQKYSEQAKQDLRRYEEEYRSVYGEEPPSKRSQANPKA